MSKQQGAPVSLRLPESVKARVTEQAGRLGMTRNALIVRYVVEGLERDTAPPVKLDPKVQTVTPVAPEVVEQAEAPESADPWTRTEPQPHRHRMLTQVPGSDNYKMGIHYATFVCECGYQAQSRVR